MFQARRDDGAVLPHPLVVVGNPITTPVRRAVRLVFR